MRKIIFVLIALVVSMAAYSQEGGRRASDREALEIKASVFFEDGTLDEYTITQWSSDFTHVESQTRYSASGMLLEKVQYHYNDKGFIINKITRDEGERIRYIVNYGNNPKGQFLGESTLLGNKLCSQIDYTYDSKGNRVSRIIKNPERDKMAETVYTYDNQGKIISSQTRDSIDMTISSTQYQYDSQGNMVKQVVKNDEGRTTTTINAVWVNGNKIKEETLAADGSIMMRITNEYGSNGELLKKTIENLQGNSKQIIQYEYTFRPSRRS